MREIEFRGKIIDNGKWVYGDLIENIDCFKIREKEKVIKQIAKSYVVDEETLGQYTGLKDKNGTKIFEGDIIEHEISKTINNKPIYICYCINYSEDERCLRAFKNGPKGYSYEISFARYCIDEKKLEVIGNIYDNPELLEV